jgi:hypothetical protein
MQPGIPGHLSPQQPGVIRLRFSYLCFDVMVGISGKTNDVGGILSSALPGRAACSI